MSTRSLSQPDPVVPMKLNTPMVASTPGAGDFGDAVVDAGRDQVRADQPVGRGAADEEGAGQQPEVAHSHGFARACGMRSAIGIARHLSRGLGLAGLAIGHKTHVGGPVAHQECDDRQ